MIKYMQIKTTTKCLFSMLAAWSCLFATPWTVASQTPLFMEFSRQESWSGLPFPSPGDLLNPGIEPRSPALQADSLPVEPPGELKIPLLLSCIQLFCDSMDYNPPGVSVHGIFQARILEWVAISFSRGSSILYHWATRKAQIDKFEVWKFVELASCI